MTDAELIAWILGRNPEHWFDRDWRERHAIREAASELTLWARS